MIALHRQFSLQEGKLAIIMMLSKFKFFMEDPNKKIGYQIIVAIKPVDLMVKVSPAELPEPTDVTVVTQRRVSKAEPSDGLNVPAKFPLPPVTFLYGTQTNTSEEYARKLSGQAKEFGFKEVKVDDLDNWKLIKGGKLAKLQNDQSAPQSEDDVKVSELLVVVTATYNGFPPDNALDFDKWLSSKTENVEDTKKNELEGVLYAVFGCGNRDWSSTFQKFPTKVDNGLELLGAERLLPAGVGDASEDIDGDFSTWSANFWSSLMQRYGQSSSGKNADIMTTDGPMADPSKDFTLEFLPAHKNKESVSTASENRNQRGQLVAIKENRELQDSEKSQRSTRHIEVSFDAPEDKKPLYEAGDHLEITPVNDPHLVEIVAVNLSLVLDSVFEIKDLDVVHLSPRSMAANIKGPCTIRNALMYYADLTGPPTRYTLSVLGKQLAHTRPDVAERLQKALQPGKETPLLKEFLSTHRTFVDIMKAFNVKELNFKEFLSSVNCIVPRKYSISSGPLEHPFDPSVVSAYVPVSTDKVCICSNFFLSLTLDRWCSARYWWS
jgi:cytochrome P450/NADPH-cytochrome P450 reductase